MFSALYIGMLFTLIFSGWFDDHHRWFILFGLLLLLNVMLIIYSGHYLLSSVSFPYTNRYIRYNLFMSTNQRFGQEFTKLLLKTVNLVKEQAMLLNNSVDTSTDYERPMQNNNAAATTF